MRYVVSVGFFLSAVFWATATVRAETVEVIGKSGGGKPQRWEDKDGNASPAQATIGKAAGRLQIKVNNGDVVRFKVASGKHGVILENAKSEMDDGVWEIVTGSGTITEIPAAWKNFDAKNARTTEPMGAGTTLLEIKIKDLKPDGSILFACNPHSTGKDPKKQPMLGVIVLAKKK
jgi:hypothetical protein